MKYQLLILVALLFSIGCRFINDDKSDATTISVIPVSDTDIIRNVNVSDVIELDSFVVLETKKESLFGRVGKVVAKALLSDIPSLKNKSIFEQRIFQ